MVTEPKDSHRAPQQPAKRIVDVFMERWTQRLASERESSTSRQQRPTLLDGKATQPAGGEVQPKSAQQKADEARSDWMKRHDGEDFVAAKAQENK